MRALATNNATRIQALPDVPTLGELGYKNSEAPLWHGLVAPAGLPVEIQQKIAADLQAVLAMPDLKANMGALGLDPTWVGTDDFIKRVKSESEKTGPLVKDLGIKLN